MKNFLSLVFALILAAVSFALPVSAEGCGHDAAYCLVCNEELPLPEGCRWDEETKTLEMKDASVFVSAVDHGFMLPANSTLSISGENIVLTPYCYAVMCCGDLTLKGNGSLQIGETIGSGKDMAVYSDGIISLDDCILTNNCFISSEGNLILQGVGAPADRIDLIETPSHETVPHQQRLPFTANTTVLNQSGSYYLTEDIELSDTLIITGSQTVIDLCLNGHSLSLADGAKGFVIYAWRGPILHIHDCSDGLGCIIGGSDFTGTLQLDNSHFTTGTFGGAISMSHSSLYLYDVTLKGSLASEGSAIKAFDSQIYIENGIITENKGTGILLKNSVLTLSGSPIINGNERDVMIADAVTSDKKAIRIGPSGLSGGTIGISSEKEPLTIMALTEAMDKDYSKFFFSSDPLCQIETTSDNQIFLTHIHAYDSDWEFNQKLHWKVCLCGRGGEQDSHEIIGPSCIVCAYRLPLPLEKPEKIQLPYELPQRKNQARYLALSIIPVIVFCGFALRKKKH